MAPRARQAKGKPVCQHERLLSQESEKVREDLEIYIPPGPRLGDVVIELDHVNKAYDDRVLINDLSVSLPPGSIVGVIGPNGSGKTTLLRMIAGHEKPDQGSVRIGDTVSLAYADQFRHSTARRASGKRSRVVPTSLDVGYAPGQLAGLCGLVQLQRLRPAEAGGHTLRW